MNATQTRHTELIRPRPSRPLISVVVPCYNEEEAVGVFSAAISETLSVADFGYEIVFIDDGSSDKTREALIALAQHEQKVRVIALSRNFGKEAALTAGLDHARGDAVVVMDADLQDPPALIMAFVEKWREGFDVVYGARADRARDTFAKRLSAEGFYRFFNRISKIKLPDDAGDFRLMDRRVVKAIKSLPERSRFMKGLFAWAGYSTIGVPYARPERAAGETKFSFWRLWNFALDGIVSFSTAPLRIWSYVGVVIALLSFAYASFIILRTLLTGVDVPGYASIVVLILFFGSVQLISVGVLGEYIARLFTEVKRRPIYLVDEVYDNEGESSQSHQERYSVKSAS
ncbi:glycosyltransferase family 2 protein [Hyphococcus flavus]|uniref:Glycosyltransferase family 2 protein n=1 Tax=Hyphococcus flavus TaxID=1866326 RepID=A0AAF0CGN9_9PROT|nr:glycosyltransferase family 2 protein [Hyphococcus flavus]WDI32413.1 glycosyltransferase family 2 protein [Hyphococcus flavus]